MSLIGLWARRCRKRVALILLGMAAVEAALFAWAAYRSFDLSLEQAVSDSHISLAALCAFTALTAVLAVAGGDNGARTSYTLRCLAATERQAFLYRAAHNTMCYYLFWGVQLAVALGLCLAWRRLLPEAWEKQTLLLAFYRVPFLHGLLPLGDWYVYPRNVLWLAALGCVTARERKSLPYSLAPFICASAIYFPQEMGKGAGWGAFLIAVSLLVIALAVWAKDADGDEAEKEASGDGAEA